jgi:hypothetical protein
MAEITDRKSLERWLEGKPREVIVAIAVRSALRVLPLLERSLRWESRKWTATDARYGLISSSFRAMIAAQFVYLAPSRAARAAAAAAYASSAAAANVYASADGTAGSSTASAAEASAAAYDAACAAASAARFAAADTERVAAAAGAARAAAAVARASAAIWSSVQSDGEALEGGKSHIEIAALPLWHDQTPDWADFPWQTLKRHLLEQQDEYWQVWTEWYDARLVGGPIDVAQESERVLSIANKDWDKGPAHVNALIAGIIDRAKQRRSKDNTTAKDFLYSPRPATLSMTGAAKPKAQTAIGVAVLESAPIIRVQLALVLILIDERIAHHQEMQPNSDTAIAAKEAVLKELSDLRGHISSLSDAVEKFPSGQISEDNLVRKAEGFFQPFQAYWQEEGKALIGKAAPTGLLAGGFGLAHMFGVDLNAIVATTALSAPLVGVQLKPLLDSVGKALPKPPSKPAA